MKKMYGLLAAGALALSACGGAQQASHLNNVPKMPSSTKEQRTFLMKELPKNSGYVVVSIGDPKKENNRNVVVAMGHFDSDKKVDLAVVVGGKGDMMFPTYSRIPEMILYDRTEKGALGSIDSVVSVSVDKMSGQPQEKVDNELDTTQLEGANNIYRIAVRQSVQVLRFNADVKGYARSRLNVYGLGAESQKGVSLEDSVKKSKPNEGTKKPSKEQKENLIKPLGTLLGGEWTLVD